jgi:hypothetical protein
MGKRSLKRRKLRSIFTFTTILTLTMSFVALTSLSTSYGLVFHRYGLGTANTEGVMVRMPVYHHNSEFEKGAFSPVISPAVDWAWDNEGVINVAKKADNTPSLRPYGGIGEWPIFGIMGIQPEVEPLMPLIDEAVVEGEPLREEGTCLLHIHMNQNAKIGIGDNIQVKGVSMKVVGFFDNVGKITDVDGETILPKYQVLISPDPPTIDVRICNEDEVVITTLETALQISRVFVSRIDVEFEPTIVLETIGKSMALSREYRVWFSEGERSYIAYMGSQIGGKGFPIIVPWAIVILNVIMTMLNSMYERQREINILSSIGLNPNHISGVFLAEASILGVIGGGVGYLMGLGLYPLMTSLAIAPIVSQKISAVWVLGAIGIAVASVIMGSILALRGSVSLTPSLIIRWTSSDQITSDRDIFESELPLKIEERDVESFIVYTVSFLKKYTDLDSLPRVGSIKILEEDGTKALSFSYNERDSSVGASRTTNRLTLIKNERNLYTPVLFSRGEREAANKAGTFIRKIVIRWSTEHEFENK